MNKIDTQSSERGQLSYPSGVAVDLYGFILVNERLKDRVSIFDNDSVFIHSFESHGSFVRLTNQGIACSPNGSIYICDNGNYRVQIFSDY